MKEAWNNNFLHIIVAQFLRSRENLISFNDQCAKIILGFNSSWEPNLQFDRVSCLSQIVGFSEKIHCLKKITNYAENYFIMDIMQTTTLKRAWKLTSQGNRTKAAQQFLGISFLEINQMLKPHMRQVSSSSMNQVFDALVS